MINLDLIKNVDFGEIDGYGDPNLEKYFLDNGYWAKIVDDKVFFVVGKKGTGKSSIYRMIERESFSKGCIVINKDFGDFPFEKLLRLQDDDFSKPNQYQTIWKNVIYNLFIQNIAKLEIGDDNDYFREIKEYTNAFLGTRAVDLHKEIVSRTTKTNGSLVAHGIGVGFENESTNSYKYNEDNITTINARLLDLITNYCITTNSTSKIILQFDRLDDNYNQYQNLEEYYQAIISLFKAVYGFNQHLRSKSVGNAKVVLYIRSDIMKAMASRDAESARWDDFRFNLNWNVNNMQDIYTSDLFKMVNKRIKASGPRYAHESFSGVFNVDKETLASCGIKTDLFKELVYQTLFRPRDLINLLKFLQNGICDYGTFNYAMYKDVLKKYSNWLVNTEIANEINPILQDDQKYVIELLRLCGSRNMSITDFTNRYNSVKHSFKMSPLELLEYLYSVGMIENNWQDRRTHKYMHRSVFRNYGDFERNMSFRILPSIWNGLTV